MVKTLLPPLSASRNFEFIGDHHDDGIVIGNYGDVKFVVCVLGRNDGRESKQGSCARSSLVKESAA